MHFVVLADHTADVCPTSNSKTRELMLGLAPQIPGIAERLGIRIVAGPFVNREHLTVAIVETDRAEDVDRFLVETRLMQWNKVHILPSLPLPEALQQMNDTPALF
jgi:hypothetical protein